MTLIVPPSASGVYLGRTTLGSAAATTATISWGPEYQWLLVYHFIAGYSGGGGIATLQLGNTTSVDTGTNYSSETSHLIVGGTTSGTHTSRVSQTGLQVANDSVTNARRGTHLIWNPDTEPKFAQGQVITYGSTTLNAATASVSQSLTVGNWWNTTARAHCIAMTGGGVNLLTGSYIDVYGLTA